SERRCQRLAHGGEMRTQLRFFGDDHCIHVRYMEPFFSEEVPDTLQKSKTRDVFPSRSGVRKMWADVAQAGRAEQRVANCVCQRVAVGMPHGPFVKGNFDSP